jgi:hypothetical protein
MRMTTYLAAAAAMACGCVAQAQLVNPSFEIPGTSTIFDQWVNFENAVPEFAIFRSGAVSVKMFGNGGGAFNAAGVYQQIPAAPGQSFQGSAYWRNDSSDPIQADNFGVVNIEWINAGGTTISFDSAAAGNASSPQNVWTQSTVQGTAPTGAVAARLVLLHLQGPAQQPGAIFFDDATLAQVTPSGLVNPGFESGLGGWSAFGNAFPGTAVNGDPARTGVGSGKMFGNFFGGDFNASGVFQQFPAEPGQTWTGSSWATTITNDRVRGGNFSVMNIEWRDVTGNLISFVSAPAIDSNSTPDVYIPVNVTGVAPAGTVAVRIVLLHLQRQDPNTLQYFGGAVWWDDVTFGQGGGGGPTCDYDFNQDENVDLLDAQQMAQVFVGLLTPEANWLDGDLNGDENSDLTDAQILAAFVVSGNCSL